MIVRKFNGNKPKVLLFQGSSKSFLTYGAKDYTKNPLPESYDVMMDPFSIDPKSAVLPYIMQMKYSGVFVPDELVQAFHINKGIDYYTANKTFDKLKEFKERADQLLENLLNYLDQKL